MELLSLVCLFVLAWSARTLGDETGPAVIKVTVEEGSDVVLPCVLSSKENLELKLFDWKKDDQKEVFMYDAGRHYNDDLSGQDEQLKGRISHFPEELRNGNASIMIRNTKVADSGNYTCDFPRLQPKRQIFHIKLVVGRVLKDRTEENIPGSAPEPSVVTLDETKDWALLQCVVRGAFPKPKVFWQDSAGNILPSPEPQVSERGGRFYVTLQTTVTKTGHFRCVATQEQTGHQIHKETFVHLSGAASEPSITTLKETKDWALLQCAVRGASPKPKVFWQDSAGNVLPAKEPEITERGDSYDIILQITVTKTDKYRCVATQEEINHQIHAETYVHMNVSEFPTGLTVAVTVLSLLLLLVGAVLFILVSKGVINLNCNKDQQGPTSLSSNSMQPSDQDSKQPLND